MGRTLLALWKWERKDPRQRLTVAACAAADFTLRFPLILDRVFDLADRSVQPALASTQAESTAPENDHLLAQHQAWTAGHRIIVGALVGRGLADLAPALESQRVEITAKGVAAAVDLYRGPGWQLVGDRSGALSKLRLAPRTLIEHCHRAVTHQR
jgi:hypothetical protein